MRRLFVLVPSLVPTGPIKGALALCNSLADKCDVTLVILKPTPACAGKLESRVRVVNLGEINNWLGRLRKYRQMLEDAGGKSQVASLSCCFSADVINSLSRRHAITLTSIRGHLLRTYRVEFGRIGILLAVIHFLIASRLEQIIAMTDHMARQIAIFVRKRPIVIGNFIDEAQIEPCRSISTTWSDIWHFVFVGRLCSLKNPNQVIDAVCQLTGQGITCSLDFYGDGPLMTTLKEEVNRRGHAEIIHFHGHVDNPWIQAANAHCLVLPSLTEGISRAVLEALYLGVPCVLRDVDSNSELIYSGSNGELFNDAESLVTAMSKAATLGMRLSSTRPILINDQFRQAHCVASHYRLLQEL
jgi:glycosyltransferase involved in cell wall biosynthesis